MSSLDEDVEQPEGERPHADVTVSVKGKLRTFRFKEMEGPDWAELTARHPVRLESIVDRQYGYNFHAVCKDAARYSGTVLEDDGEYVKVKPDTWKKMWPQLTGHDFTKLCDAIWSLNEWEPSQRVERLLKESGLASDSKPSSD